MDTEDNEIRERQENEICVLKSIYEDNFIDLKTDTTNTSNKPNFKIILHPLNSQSQADLNNEHKQQYVQIEIKVQFTKNYPNE